MAILFCYFKYKILKIILYRFKKIFLLLIKGLFCILILKHQVFPNKDFCCPIIVNWSVLNLPIADHPTLPLSKK